VSSSRSRRETNSQQFDIHEPITLKAGEAKELTLELDATIFEKIRFIEARRSSYVTNPQLVGLVIL
jgi:hypothetical protein